MHKSTPICWSNHQSWQDIDHLVEDVLIYFDHNFKTIPSMSHESINALQGASSVLYKEVNELEIILKRDPATLTELLRIANSSFYRGNTPAVTIQSAIVRLGRQEVYNILSTVAANSLFDQSKNVLYHFSPEHWQYFHMHSVVCGFATGFLADFLNIEKYDVAFVSGMFYDIGLFVSLCSLGSVMVNQEEMIQQLPMATIHYIIEKTSEHLGLQALKKWDMPASVIDIFDKQKKPSTPIQQIARFVSCLHHRWRGFYMPYGIEQEINNIAELLNIDHAMLDNIEKKMHTIVDGATQLIGQINDTVVIE